MTLEQGAFFLAGAGMMGGCWLATTLALWWRVK